MSAAPCFRTSGVLSGDTLRECSERVSRGKSGTADPPGYANIALDLICHYPMITCSSGYYSMTVLNRFRRIKLLFNLSNLMMYNR
jgi:hypothetical protein